jgi:hypothetical protein
MRPTPRAARLAPAAYALFLGLNSQAAPDAPKSDAPKSDAAKAEASADQKHRLEPLFGATVKATYPDGRFQRYQLAPDGSWTGIGRRGGHSAGRWSLKADRLCLRRTRPVPAPIKYCTPLPEDLHIGASWPAKDLGGGPITLSLVKGGRSSPVQDGAGKTP